MLCFDSSALVKCYQEEEHSPWVREIMASDPDWCGSALLAAEGPIALSRSVPEADDLQVADARISRDLGFFFSWQSTRTASFGQSTSVGISA